MQLCYVWHGLRVFYSYHQNNCVAVFGSRYCHSCIKRKFDMNCTKTELEHTEHPLTSNIPIWPLASGTRLERSSQIVVKNSM